MLPSTRYKNYLMYSVYLYLNACRRATGAVVHAKHLLDQAVTVLRFPTDTEPPDNFRWRKATLDVFFHVGNATAGVHVDVGVQDRSV